MTAAPMVGDCPSDNMTCVLTMWAEVQAAIDQLIGTAEAVLADSQSAVAGHIAMKNQIRVAIFMQRTLDDYALKHTGPNAEYTVRAARKLRQYLGL